MNASDRYDEIFMNLFQVSKDELAGLQYQGVKAWDSVGHMNLITELEQEYDIMMDTDDVIDLSSYSEGKRILRENYDVEID